MGFKSLSVKRHPTVLSQSWCELILLWSLVSFNVVVVFVLLWRRCGYELVFLWRIMSDHESFDPVFAIFFSFMSLAIVFILCRGDEDEWWPCSGSVIWYENLESGFLN